MLVDIACLITKLSLLLYSSFATTVAKSHKDEIDVNFEVDDVVFDVCVEQSMLVVTELHLTVCRELPIFSIDEVRWCEKQKIVPCAKVDVSSIGVTVVDMTSLDGKVAMLEVTELVIWFADVISNVKYFVALSSILMGNKGMGSFPNESGNKN